MKSLLLVRHAKSSWEHSELGDHDRPLNSRGLNDLPRMANRLKDRNLSVDACWTSTAVRAQTTALAIAPFICQKSVKPIQQLYTFDPIELMHEIQQAPDNLQALAVFGHNPALHELTNLLTDCEDLDSFPTCSMAWLELDIRHWADLHKECASLNFFDWPKRLKD